jgi:hypothetical protein
MNAKLFFSLSAATAAIAASSVAAPAQAFEFGTGALKFDADTEVSFTFQSTQGFFQSSLSVFNATGTTKLAPLFTEVKRSDNGAENDFFGSFGNAVTSSTGFNPVSFLFKGGVEYTLGLESDNGTVFSTNTLNTAGLQQAIFGGGSVFNPGGISIAFDDLGNGDDSDFNDFKVQAAAVPEPLTMSGIALAGAGLAYARRQRRSA